MASVMKADPRQHCTVVAAQEGLSQSYKAGDLLQFSGGQVIIATAGYIHAIALEDATGTQNTETMVELIDSNTAYVTPYKASTTALATSMHVIHDFVFTLGGHTLDENGATTDCYVVGTLDPWGTTSGKLIWKVKPAATIHG